MKKIIISLLLVQTMVLSLAREKDEIITINGSVFSQKGEPLVFANVYFADDLSGCITDTRGQFIIHTRKPGKRPLVVIFIGYKKVTKIIDISSRDIDDLTIRMKEETLQMNHVSVTASSFSLSDEEGTTLSAMDVVTTAGAAADIMRAIQTFSGVTSVDEGAGLFVRGGDVSETKVILDQGIMKHPYRYESPTGGYFGMFSPFLLSGTYFSSGAFSARYGNAISGVLAMESLGMPQNPEFNLGIGLAATSAAMDYPIIKNKFGLRFSGNLTSTDLMFSLNGITDQFSKPPCSDDANLSLHYRVSDSSILKTFIYVSKDQIGVEAITPSYQGYITSKDINNFYLINWKHTINSSIFVETTLSTNRFSKDIKLGIIDLKTEDNTLHAKTAVEYALKPNLTFHSGFETAQCKTYYNGSAPLDPNDIQGLDSVLTFNGTTCSNVSGAYIESEIKLAKICYANAGFRWDYQHQQKRNIYAPRFSLIVRLSEDQNLKFASGLYHQFPDAYYLEKENGNPDLKPVKAIHYVAGWEYSRESILCRIEGYIKSYSDLVLNDAHVRYTNKGHGHAKGVDLFFKNDAGLVTGWIAYSYLHSRRKEKLYNTGVVPTDYDITHNLSIALKLNISALWGVSATYRYSSGKPFHTAPGEWNAGRGASYKKLDLSFTRLVSFFNDNLTVFYFSIANILGRENVVQYTYTYDYSKKYARKSTNNRSVYFGVNFNF
jgi:hypothetical protein